jgi:tripartite-type tricarboxylate transporter receptor subunit TctC
MPDVPTFIEAGLPKVVVENWFGVSGPAGLPAPVTDRLSATLAAVLAQPELAGKLRDLGVETQVMTPAATTAFVRENLAFWADAVKRAGITPN